jgi:hypothetical protein
MNVTTSTAALLPINRAVPAIKIDRIEYECHSGVLINPATEVS